MWNTSGVLLIVLSYKVHKIFIVYYITYFLTVEACLFLHMLLSEIQPILPLFWLLLYVSDPNLVL